MDQLPRDISVQRLLGGLAPDSNEPMPLEMQRYLQQTWRTIQQQVPGTQFNFDFWSECKPRRSTYPACRAVIAAQNQGEQWTEPMASAIQEAYYLQAKNPSDDSVLVALADSLGLDLGQFERDLHSKKTQAKLTDELTHCRSMGLNSFPSLVLVEEGRLTRLRHDYNDVQVLLAQL